MEGLRDKGRLPGQEYRHLADEVSECKSYSLRRHFLIVGLGGTAFFSAMGVASTVAALLNIDGSFDRPVLYATLFASFWFAFVLLGLYLLLAYRFERLYLSESGVETRGVFRKQRVRFDELLSARWRIRPRHGSLVLRSRTGKVTVSFGNYETPDREELVSSLRRACNDVLQTGWDDFESHSTRSHVHQPKNYRAVGVLLWSFTILFTCAWLFGLGGYYAIYALANAIVAGLIVRRGMKRGNGRRAECR